MTLGKSYAWSRSYPLDFPVNGVNEFLLLTCASADWDSVTYNHVVLTSVLVHKPHSTGWVCHCYSDLLSLCVPLVEKLLLVRLEMVG